MVKKSPFLLVKSPCLMIKKVRFAQKNCLSFEIHPGWTLSSTCSTSCCSFSLGFSKKMGISDFTKRNIEKHRKKTENLGNSMDFHGFPWDYGWSNESNGDMNGD